MALRLSGDRETLSGDELGSEPGRGSALEFLKNREADMSRPIVYIDGREGTTGLQIYDRLSAREELNVLPGDRKSVV